MGVGPNRNRTEFEAGELTLEPPVVPVDDENPSAQQVSQDSRHGQALRVVIKTGPEHVLHVVRVGRYGVIQYMDVDGLSERLVQKVGVPIWKVQELLPPLAGHERGAYLALATAKPCRIDV